MADFSFSGGGLGVDKGLRLKLADTMRMAWQDPDLRKRLQFILLIFVVYAFGVHVPVPIPGFDAATMSKLLENNSYFNIMNTIGGGAFKRISIFALGLGPYISASIIMQVLTFAIPQWKEELKEGGEYARRAQNKRTRLMMLVLCVFQGWGLIHLMGEAVTGQLTTLQMLTVVAFWGAGSMFLLWLGEQLSEKGIGNGTSLLIFAGICIGVPNVVDTVRLAIVHGSVSILQIVAVLLLYVAVTWLVVFFTIAQRRIPVEHIRRNFGTKSVGGKTSYLPISVNLAGVMPIIFALALMGLPRMLAGALRQDSPAGRFITEAEKFLFPDFTRWQGYIGALVYTFMIFFFTYFYTSIQYNIDDIADNLKRGGSFIRGIRPGKQTRDYLDGVISRVTLVGAAFLAIIALSQYVITLIAPITNLALIGGTSLLILVSVALETMRQIEANLLAKQYEN
ncbi:MAG: preprotein translocase subunit SecY [Armatimonadota bacterium]